MWVKQVGLQEPPLQGFVVQWTRYSYQWWAMVLTVHTSSEGPPLTTMAWVRAERLTPVKSDPNDGRAFRLWR